MTLHGRRPLVWRKLIIFYEIKFYFEQLLTEWQSKQSQTTQRCSSTRQHDAEVMLAVGMLSKDKDMVVEAGQCLCQCQTDSQQQVKHFCLQSRITHKTDHDAITNLHEFAYMTLLYGSLPRFQT